MPLSPRQRQHLRALAHHLDPVVQIGHEGVTEAVTAQIDAALAAHELIKVRLGSECPTPREELADSLPPATRAELVQLIGRILVLFRRRPKKPKVALSAGAAAGAEAARGSKGRLPATRKRSSGPRRAPRGRGRGAR